MLLQKSPYILLYEKKKQCKMPPQKAISIEQKINLQQYKAAMLSLSLKSLQSWFESRYSHSISCQNIG